VPTCDQTTQTVAKVLVNELFFRFGVCKRIHSNRGKSFESEIIQQLCTIYRIKKTRTTAYHPQGNGQCERFNRTLHDLLRSLPPARKMKWPEYMYIFIQCDSACVYWIFTLLFDVWTSAAPTDIFSLRKK
jgi:transposase InsO family protein